MRQTNGSGHSGSIKKRKLDHIPADSPVHTGTPQSAKGERKFANSRSVNELFATGIGQGGEGARGRLWVCDVSVPFSKTGKGAHCASAVLQIHAFARNLGQALGRTLRPSPSDRLTPLKSSCHQLQPPGRRVYQKGSYSIYEVDGAEETVGARSEEVC